MKLVVYSGYRAVVPSKRLLQSAKCARVAQSVQRETERILCIHRSSVVKSHCDRQVEAAIHSMQLRLCKVNYLVLGLVRVSQG